MKICSERDSEVKYRGISPAARYAHAPRSLRVPTRSTVDLPKANAFPFPTRSDNAVCPEHLLHGFRSCGQPLFPEALVPLRPTRNTISTDPLGQIRSSARLRKIPDLLRRCGANLFRCRSPFISCASSASITWDPTASRRRPVFSSHPLTTILFG